MLFKQEIARLKGRYHNWQELKQQGDNFNKSYIGNRSDILELIDPSFKKILDVGCSVGRLGADIKLKTTGEVIGIEINAEMSQIAAKKLNKIIIGDVEELNTEVISEKEYFDCIIFGDILEHLKDPWSTLKEYSKLLKKNGVIILSLPNISHVSTLSSLIFLDYWPYRERGIHDKTHLRFFTLKNIRELVHYADLSIIKTIRKYRLIEKGHVINIFSFLFSLPFIKKFITFSYLIIAVKK